MAGQLDSVMRPVAERLIEQFGGPMVYSRITETFDAASGKTSQTAATFNVIGTPPAPYNQGRIDGTVIQVADLKSLLKALNLGFTPTIGDRVNFNEMVWQVVGVRPIWSGALPAAYEIQLRQ